MRTIYWKLTCSLSGHSPVRMIEGWRSFTTTTLCSTGMPFSGITRKLWAYQKLHLRLHECTGIILPTDGGPVEIILVQEFPWINNGERTNISWLPHTFLCPVSRNENTIVTVVVVGPTYQERHTFQRSIQLSTPEYYRYIHTFWRKWASYIELDLPTVTVHGVGYVIGFESVLLDYRWGV